MGQHREVSYRDPAVPPGVIVVFRSRRRPDHEDEYQDTLPAVLEEVRALPGFLGNKTYRADDGENVNVIHLADADALERWRAHPVHVPAKRRGREAFYAQYELIVADVTRVSSFPAEA